MSSTRDSFCKTNKESHLYRKDHFHMNPLFFKIIAHFEADNEGEVSNIGNRTTNVYIEAKSFT